MPATGTEIAVLAGHQDWVESAAFSPDGTRIVTASSDTTARLWDAATGAEIAVFAGHNGSVNNAVFSPDGTLVVTASDDGTARIWDISESSWTIGLSDRLQPAPGLRSGRCDGALRNDDRPAYLRGRAPVTRLEAFAMTDR